MVFLNLMSGLDYRVPTKSQICCSWLIGIEPDVVFCTCGPSTSKRVQSEMIFYSTWLSTLRVIPVSSNQPLSSHLSHNQSKFLLLVELVLTWYLLCFTPSHVIALKIQWDQQFLIHSNPSGTNNLATVKVSNYIFPVLLFDEKWSSWAIPAWLYAYHWCYSIE